MNQQPTVTLVPEQGLEDPVEVQCQVDAEFYARWAAAIPLHIYRGQVTGAWYPVVIYPDRATESAAPLALVPFTGHPWMHGVYLDEALPEGAVLSPGLALVRLIVAPRKPLRPRPRR